MVDREGIITTIAGAGFYDYSGDGGPSTSAGFTYPEGICLDASGNLYVADERSEVVRKIVPFGAARVLSLTNGAVGQYEVIVTSPFGSITSSVVTLSSGTIQPPPSPPVITSAVRSGAGSVTLNLQTSPNTTSIIYAATSLKPPIQWQPIYTNSDSGPSGIWQFTDSSVDSYQTRFFIVSTQ
jgi:hypothetical protein